MAITDHKNRNLKLSYLSAIFGCGMTGFTQDFLTPLLLFLGGSARHVGIMNSLNNLFASVMQTIGADLAVKLRSRKKVVSLFILGQCLALLGLLALALRHDTTPELFILTVVLFTTFGAFTLPPWLSLLSDMVPHTRRGTYFGWRSRNLGFIIVAMTLTAGFILYTMAPVSRAAGFAIIFGTALILRLLSWRYLKKMAEPDLAFNRTDYFTFFDFIKRHKESNFVQFVIYVSAINFSVNLAAPFFAVLMLRDLKFNYLLFSLINITAPLTLYSMIHRWGRHADQVGNIKVIKTVAPLFSLIPLLWIMNQNPLFLIAAETFSGFLWSGFNLCTSNFVMDAVSPGKRTRCLSYFSLINGIALATGAIVGGFMLHYLPPLFHQKIFTLFVISSILRFSAGYLLSCKVNEVRPVDRVRSRHLMLSMLGIKPLAGIH